MEGTGGAAQRRVRIAVFPVAGFAENFLPATKACPKELLPIVDRPLIQYAVEEAAAAGLTRMVLVTGRGKRAVEDHFDHAYELERELIARSNHAALAELRSAVPAGVTFSYVHQPDASGLPDAIVRVRPIVGEEPFAVVLPDHLIDGERPALAQLLEVFDEQQVSVVGAQRVASASRGIAGLIGADLRESAVRSARALVNVPPIGAGSTPLAAVGRYVFTAAIWEALEHARGEDDGALSQTIHLLMECERVFACVIDGRRFDCGSKLGFLEAQVAFAQKRRELWPALARNLRALVAEQPESLERSIPRAALTSNPNAAATDGARAAIVR
jgi:UTP--glucose-1-phosphate uridylyltransferase